MAGALPTAVRRVRRSGRATAQVLPLEVIRGRPFLRREGALVLLDTSARVGAQAGGAAERAFGVRFSEALGLDALRGQTLLLDRGAGKVELGTGLVSGEAVPLAWTAGWPCVPIAHAGTRRMAVLDSASPLSYGPARVVLAGRDQDTRWEWVPGLGLVEIHTARVRVAVGCRALELRMGILPAAMRLEHQAMGWPDWVLGSEPLLRRRTALDFAANRLVIASSRLP